MLQKNTGETYYFIDWPLFSAINKGYVFIHTGSLRVHSCRKST